ncbi:MAG: tetratricopeptide repeat protein [Phycisphaerales bacterium]|nr:tetratricopeptide repeat protein [Phycisphaerales bacterium]
MLRSTSGLTLACCLSVFMGCSGAKRVPFYEGLGDHHREVTTTSPKAQRYFDQGLIWAYAFNHDEAIRSFMAATRLDPDCAMAWWGIALCNGPHINNPVVPPDRAKGAWRALQRAMALKEKASPTEQSLIVALSSRYAYPQPSDRQPLDKAYAEAMHKVWDEHRNDPDVGTLYAEAMMDLRPWDLWTQDGRAKPGTEEILRVLEHVLRLDPNNPGANHLYIHALEASAHPERADASARRLRDLVPGSGHLTHMPSHIDVLTGRWRLASMQNIEAIRADRRYRRRSPKQGFYHVYMLHNHHMLSFSSMMEGRSEAAIRAARDAVESVPKSYMKREPHLIDPYMGAAYDALKRFGRWDEILIEPAPPSYLPITTAMWRFTRGLAYAARGDVASATKEREAFQSASSRVPEDAMMAINPARNILKIAAHMLDGEIAFRRGEIDRSVDHLRKAIEVEDKLLYMEPPEWVQPMRHTLGAVLLSAGRFDEAEQVYREDLEKWHENGWSLYGLSRCFRGRGEISKAAAVEARLRKAWFRADIPIATSCLCVPKT